MASMTLLAQGVSFVVVGDGFKPSMFKPDDFFDGAVDDDQTVVQGPFCQFQYRSGLYGLSVVPNRVNVKTVEQDLLSSDLTTNVRRVFGILDKFKGAVTVSAWGMNCEADFAPSEIGVEYCNNLVDKSRFNHLLCGDETGAVSAWLKGLVEYRDLMMTVRIEPKADSEGRDLFVAVNGHRDMSETDGQLVADMNDRVAQFREYVEALHERILGS